MYLKHFDLKKSPFQLTPDTEFLYLSLAHARVKAHMSYTVWKWDGFAVVTGKTGSGKTTLVRQLLARVDKSVSVMLIRQTQLNEIEFLRFLLANFGIDAFNAEKAELIAQLNSYLIQEKSRGRRVLLVIDEAQHLSPRILEELRLLSDIRVKGEQALNLILVGHTSLLKTLRLPALEQLSQRVRLWFDLKGLSQKETKEYIQYRLAVAGSRLEGVFTDTSVALIHRFSDGIPRMINIICEAAMVAAYVDHEKHVTAKNIKTAIEELQWPQYTGRHVLKRLKHDRPKKQAPAQQVHAQQKSKAKQKPSAEVTQNTTTIIQGEKRTEQVTPPLADIPQNDNPEQEQSKIALDFA
jgi:type II secretory pathway predicted ATPase ExeA